MSRPENPVAAARADLRCANRPGLRPHRRRSQPAGGGTGGHIYPGIAVAEELRRLDPKIEFLFVGSDRGLEGKVVPSAGFDLATIPARGVVRTRWWRFPGAMWGNLVALLKAMSLMREFRPDVVLGTGGYVSMPVGVADVTRIGPDIRITADLRSAI